MFRFRSFSLLSALILLSTFASAAKAQSVDRAALEGEIRGLLSELKATEQQFLAPSAKDQRKNADFLSQPDTGLIRLLPRGVFDAKISISGGGVYYSFARLTHEYGYGSDIELQQGQFMVGFAGADFGFLTRVGKTALEEVTVDHPAAQFVATFNAPTSDAEAREQGRRAGAGFEINGFTYNARVPVKAKSAYLLRSINYNRSDLLVAFRVVSQDTDGSVVILWKILKKFPVPNLVAAQAASSKQ
jgi:hypothetical protein